METTIYVKGFETTIYVKGFIDFIEQFYENRW